MVVEVVDRPATTSDFPGLYLNVLPTKPFVTPRVMVFTNRQWGTLATVAVDVYAKKPVVQDVSASMLPFLTPSLGL